MAAYSDRLGLPLLAVAQAQKEMAHNEALAMLDLAVQTVVEAVAPASVPVSPLVGQCWIVGPNPSGAWAGHASALAGWTAGGWRFVTPFEGMQVWSAADETVVRRSGSVWIVGKMNATAFCIGGVQVVGGRQAHIAAPIGGTGVDAEARVAISAMLAVLRTHGLIASA